MRGNGESWNQQMLMERLDEQCSENAGHVNLGEWISFMTWDLVGDLTFGDPFGALDIGTLFSF